MNVLLFVSSILGIALAIRRFFRRVFVVAVVITDRVQLLRRMEDQHGH